MYILALKFKLLKKHKKESSKWLNRQINDEFVLRSKKEGFRSRSSYKLIQINEKFDFLNSSKNILGMIPHPERMVDEIISSKDGINLFSSLLN